MLSCIFDTMTIRTLLTLLFSSIVSALLLIFCVVIYLESEFNRQREFKARLREEALTSAEILFGKEEISPDLLKLLDKNQMTVLTEEEIVVYDSKDSLIYESGTDYLKTQAKILSKIRQEKELFIREDKREILGLIYNNGKENLVIVASAWDKYGFSEQRNLGLMLAIGGILMVGMVW